LGGEPTYIELGVPDVAAARKFYRGLLGWKVSGRSGSGSVDTATLSIGIHDEDDERHFQVFFAVTDLDKARAKITKLGGATIGEVHDESDFGRWIECMDDQGVRFGLREMR
jgi:predicted enzyme related to lactoylglutathione lyase